MSNGRIYLSVILFLFFMMFSLICYVNHKHLLRTEEIEVRKVYFQLLSISHLASCNDCVSTRNLLEGVYGCLSDMPGGYCYHSSCDVVLAPDFPENEILNLVVKRGQN